MRVLIIEDNEDTAATLRVLLHIFGHEAQIAGTGPSGIECARRWRPEVILCDIGIPGLNGYEVARRLRRDPEMAGVYLIAVSGFAQEDERPRAFAAGFDRLMAKPVDPEDIQQLLVRLTAQNAKQSAPVGSH